MEQNVKINSVVSKTSTTSNKKYQSINYDNNLWAKCMEGEGDFTGLVGQTVTVDLHTSKDGDSTFFKMPGVKPATGQGQPAKKPFTPYPKADPTLELRKFALSVGLDACKLDKFSGVNLSKYTKIAEKYLQSGEI